jgi:hypothetical protein
MWLAFGWSALVGAIVASRRFGHLMEWVIVAVVFPNVPLSQLATGQPDRARDR